MPVPLPDSEVHPAAARRRRSADDAGGVAAAIAPAGGLTGLQRLLIEALIESMTGFVVPAHRVPRLEPARVRAAHARDATQSSANGCCSSCCSARSSSFRFPDEVVARVEEYANELGIDERDAPRRRAVRARQSRARARSTSSAAATWRRGIPTHPRRCTRRRALADAWEQCVLDPALAAALGGAARVCPRARSAAKSRSSTTRGASRSRALPGSAPPLLAQHDWVHVLADYGSTVEGELEVFGFISAPTTIRAHSRCSRWSSACSRPDTSQAVPACSSTTVGISRTRAWRCGSPTRCGVVRWLRRARRRPRPAAAATGSPTPHRPVADVRGGTRRRSEVRERASSCGFGDARGNPAASRRTSTSAVAAWPRPPAAQYDSYGASQPSEVTGAHARSLTRMSELRTRSPSASSSWRS